MDIDSWIAHCRDGGILPERKLRLLCEMVKQVLIEEGNVVEVSAPVTVVGNVHAKFYELVSMMEKIGETPSKSYLFLGNYVDKYFNSCETIQYLLCLKVKYPDRITLLRGNHEDRRLSEVYGFFDESLRKYGN